MATAAELQQAAATAAANAASTTPTTAATATETTTTEFNPYDYNARISEINRMYDSYADSQRANLTNAYNQNLSNLEANRGKIAQQYQMQRNANAVNYERARRNFNQQALMNGLNTGAGSQAALAQNNQYQRSTAQLGAAEASSNADLEKSIADLKVQYEGDVNEAIAKNDYNRAASLLDEYNNAYSQAMTRAQSLAQYGDFSGYAAIYGDDAAAQMKATWQIQNPLIAYNLGQISAKKYRKITGHYPPGYHTSSGSSSYGYSGRSSRAGNGPNVTLGGVDPSMVTLSDLLVTPIVKPGASNNGSNNNSSGSSSRSGGGGGPVGHSPVVPAGGGGGLWSNVGTLR